MPKISEGQYALGGLTLLALWLFVALPFVHSPAEIDAQKPKRIERPEQHRMAQPQGTEEAPFFVEVIPAPKSAEEYAQEVEDRNEKKSADRWLVRWTAALFFATIGLIFATGALGYFALRQLRDNKEAIAAAKKAADAAELSAQASIGLQLPRLIVQAMSMYMPGQPRGTYQPYTTNFNLGVPPEWFQVGIQIDNVGKTNATVTEQCVEQFVGPRLPKVPQYQTIVPMPVGEVIRAEDGILILHTKNRFFNLTAEQRHAMEAIELSHRLWIYGFLRFTDFMGKPHEQRFCKRWNPLRSPGGPEAGFISESNTPEEYTKGY